MKELNYAYSSHVVIELLFASASDNPGVLLIKGTRMKGATIKDQTFVRVCTLSSNVEAGLDLSQAILNSLDKLGVTEDIDTNGIPLKQALEEFSYWLEEYEFDFIWAGTSLHAFKKLFVEMGVEVHWGSNNLCDIDCLYAAMSNGANITKPKLLSVIFSKLE